MKILLNAAHDYPPIRTLLGVSETELPDLTVEQPPFLPTAEAIISGGITGYAELSGDNALLLKAGTQALTAALLCEAFARGEMFRVGDYWEQGSTLDWKERAKDLLAAAQRALGAINTRALARRTSLVLAGPTRSGSDVPIAMEQWVERIVPRFVDWVEEGGEDDEWK